jgi:hypothetical protein
VERFMGDAVPWVGFVIGLATVLATGGSIVTTVIMPRFSRSRIALTAWRLVERPYIVLARKLPSYNAKDRVLAALGPMAVIATLILWIVLLFVGYALMFWPLIHGDFGAAMELSGSSLFTLGFDSIGRPGPMALEFLAAGSGLLVVAIQISYLPTLYSTYNRRETLVTALAGRAGVPTWGPEILARHYLSEAAETLPALYAAWETLAADVAESHSSYPWLMVFRSPNPLQHWVVSMLAILDSAALYISLAPGRVPAEARQCLRMGYLCLRALAREMGFQVSDDPRPDDPIALTFEQYSRGVEHLRRAGFPLERDAAESWADFRGWRVNYEMAAYKLADYFIAVPAPWSGTRSFLSREAAFDVLRTRPRYRTPDDPEGMRVLERAEATGKGGKAAAFAEPPLVESPPPDVPATVSPSVPHDGAPLRRGPTGTPRPGAAGGSLAGTKPGAHTKGERGAGQAGTVKRRG